MIETAKLLYHGEIRSNSITLYCAGQIAKLHVMHLSLSARIAFDQTALANTTNCDYLGPRPTTDEEHRALPIPMYHINAKIGNS